MLGVLAHRRSARWSATPPAASRSFVGLLFVLPGITAHPARERSADAINPYLPLNAGITVATSTFENPHHLSPWAGFARVLRLRGAGRRRGRRRAAPARRLTRRRLRWTGAASGREPRADRVLVAAGRAGDRWPLDVAIVAAIVGLGTLGGPTGAGDTTASRLFTVALALPLLSGAGAGRSACSR